LCLRRPANTRAFRANPMSSGSATLWISPSRRKPVGNVCAADGSSVTTKIFHDLPLVLSYCPNERTMKVKPIKLLDTVALLENIPARKVRAGEVGTVVEILGEGVYEVEFCDEDGQTYAQFALRADQIMPLHSRGKSFRMPLTPA